MNTTENSHHNGCVGIRKGLLGSFFFPHIHARVCTNADKHTHTHTHTHTFTHAHAHSAIGMLNGDATQAYSRRARGRIVSGDTHECQHEQHAVG